MCSICQKPISNELSYFFAGGFDKTGKCGKCHAFFCVDHIKEYIDPILGHSGRCAYCLNCTEKINNEIENNASRYDNLYYPLGKIGGYLLRLTKW